jgi:NhaA family Na+:H+ antiporter
MNRLPLSAHPSVQWILRFLRIEAASGALLLCATLLAVVWASSSGSATYFRLWHTPLPLGTNAVRPDVLFLVNEGLMAGFFLLVGLEVRRELHAGTLANLRVAGLPLLAALGGIVTPALIYLLCAPEAPRGWAVPTATDIAFAAGVLSLAGRGTPPGLRVLLLTLAIADDIAAVLVIALFYSHGLGPSGLLLAAGGAAAQLALQRTGRDGWISYLLAGAVIWQGLWLAGVHPALAGALLGMITPVTARPQARAGRSQRLPACVRIEAALHPWVSFLIMPLFVLANAGVDVRGLSVSPGVPWHVATGITAGLVVGKPLGIIVTARLAIRYGLVTLPTGVRPPHLLLLGCLGGIGFTMSMFLCNLAFPEPALLRTARVAVLGASALAAALSALAALMLPGLRVRPIPPA